MKRRALLLAGIAAAVGAAALGGCGGTVTANVTSGATYKSVTIGSQTWMAENLNVETSSGSWCYENSADSCAKYGRLYTWEAARKVCPAGWHLPSNEEWNTLGIYVGGWEVAGKKLKSTSWDGCGENISGNGTDDFGFSALPGGGNIGGDFSGGDGYDGYWWTATESGSGNAYGRVMSCNYNVIVDHSNGKSDGYSVRCVRN